MTSRVKSGEFVLAILDCFTEDTFELGVSEIARRLHKNKSIVSRMLVALERGNLLARSEVDNKYRLGPKVLRLASVFSATTDILTIAKPYIRQLQKITDETVNLFALHGDHRICLAAADSLQPVKVTIKIGDLLPIHTGSSGKLFLAYMPATKRKGILARTGLPKLAVGTLDKMADLDKELRRIRRQGFAVSIQERSAGMASVGAPIFDHEGCIVAVLTVAGPLSRFNSDQRDRHITEVKKMADSISREVGYVVVPRKRRRKRVPTVTPPR